MPMNNAQQKHLRNEIGELKDHKLQHIRTTPLKKSADVLHAESMIRQFKKVVRKYERADDRAEARRRSKLHKSFLELQTSILFDSPEVARRKIRAFKAKTF